MLFKYTEGKKEVTLDVHYTILPVKLRGEVREVLLEVVAYNAERDDVYDDLDFDLRCEIEEKCFEDHAK